MKYEIKPCDFPKTLTECPPGIFAFEYNGEYYFGFKTEYGDGSDPQVFNEAGEYFCGKGLITPCVIERVEA